MFKTLHFSWHLQIGIIGGTGFEEPHILQNKTEKFVDTPFGKVGLIEHGTF